MKFHPDKCNVQRVTNKTKKTAANYHLYGHTLELVTSAKYLGLTITNKLQWDQHINNITAKANTTLGFLRRNLNIPSIRIKGQAYQTLVRPLVEYASTVWNPYTKTEINKLKPYKEEQLDMSSATRETDLVSATCSRVSI
jgi:hypothetical protein